MAERRRVEPAKALARRTTCRSSCRYRCVSRCVWWRRLVVAGWLALAALHVRDDYHVTHVQGVWMAAAEAARAGQLYPPLFDGEHYAGTRYMPLAILLNAVASGIVGDPLVGGKLLAAILMATLLALVISMLRAFSCPWPVALRAGCRRRCDRDRPAGRHHGWRRHPSGGAAGRRSGNRFTRPIPRRPWCLRESWRAWRSPAS